LGTVSSRPQETLTAGPRTQPHCSPRCSGSADYGYIGRGCRDGEHLLEQRYMVCRSCNPLGNGNLKIQLDREKPVCRGAYYTSSSEQLRIERPRRRAMQGSEGEGGRQEEKKEKKARRDGRRIGPASDGGLSHAGLHIRPHVPGRAYFRLIFSPSHPPQPHKGGTRLLQPWFGIPSARFGLTECRIMPWSWRSTSPLFFPSFHRLRCKRSSLTIPRQTKC
jgi:hypothetical protein